MLICKSNLMVVNMGDKWHRNSLESKFEAIFNRRYNILFHTSEAAVSRCLLTYMPRKFIIYMSHFEILIYILNSFILE